MKTSVNLFALFWRTETKCCDYFHFCHVLLSVTTFIPKYLLATATSRLDEEFYAPKPFFLCALIPVSSLPRLSSDL